MAGVLLTGFLLLIIREAQYLHTVLTWGYGGLPRRAGEYQAYTQGMSRSPGHARDQTQGFLYARNILLPFGSLSAMMWVMKQLFEKSFLTSHEGSKQIKMEELGLEREKWENSSCSSVHSTTVGGLSTVRKDQGMIPLESGMAGPRQAQCKCPGSMLNSLP